MTRPAAIVALALTLGCGGNTGPGGSAYVSFSYTNGGTSGTFSATGSPTPPTVASAPYAFGSTAAVNNRTEIDAAQLSGIFSNAIFMFYKGPAAGTGTIDPTCKQSGPTDACNALLFQIGADAPGDFDYGLVCGLTSGAIIVSSISSSSASGSFSGSGSCTTQTGVQTPFIVTGGTFTVPLKAS